jgi:hypothetical protein
VSWGQKGDDVRERVERDERERTSQRISNRFRISLVFFSSHQRLLRRDEAAQLLGRGLTSIADVSEQAQAESGEEQEERGGSGGGGEGGEAPHLFCFSRSPSE